MKTEQLIYLEDIAKTHSISQTAQRLFISQQALSFSLSKLEEEFGVTFLIRTNRGVELTPEGVLFLEKSRTILNTYKELKDELFFHTATIDIEPLDSNSAITIYCHTRILEPLLIDLLERYTKNYPQVSIELYENENIEIIEKIANGDGDLGLIFAPDFIFNKSSEYRFLNDVLIEQLFSDKFVICCNKNYPLKNNKSIKMASLNNHPTIFFDTNVFSLTGEQTSPITSHQYYSNNMSFHKAMIRRGLAISLITSFEFRKLYFKNKDITALPILDSPQSIIALITNKSKQITPAAQLLIDMLRKYDFYNI